MPSLGRNVVKLNVAYVTWKLFSKVHAFSVSFHVWLPWKNPATIWTGYTYDYFTVHLIHVAPQGSFWSKYLVAFCADVLTCELSTVLVSHVTFKDSFWSKQFITFCANVAVNQLAVVFPNMQLVCWWHYCMFTICARHIAFPGLLRGLSQLTVLVFGLCRFYVIGSHIHLV